MDMQCSRWLFSKVPFKTSLMHFDSHELEDVSARMFNSTLVYARLESSGTEALSASIYDDAPVENVTCGVRVHCNG